MDPFECRLNFIALLEKLNASQQSIHKVAHYAVRHCNLAEDLYSCLLEQLDKASINARVNIIYVLDSIFTQGKRAGFNGYQDLTRHDLARIIKTVVPNDSKGNVNIGNTLKILSSWRKRKYFDGEVIDTVEKPLLDREAAAAGSSQTTAGEDGFSKEDILRRMEEDRERHKRFREEVWIRPAEESVDAEFQQLWESTEPLVPETDYEMMMLQNMLRLPQYAWHHMLSQRSPATENNTMAATTTTTTTTTNTNTAVAIVTDNKSERNGVSLVPRSVSPSSPSPPTSKIDDDPMDTTADQPLSSPEEENQQQQQQPSPSHSSQQPSTTDVSTAVVPSPISQILNEDTLLSPESSPLTPTSP